MTGPTAGAVVQIHPTLNCNLACAHCYSTSSPQRREALDADLLERFLADAQGEGFDAVGFSGGEPLVYRPLAQLLAAARRLGLATSVTTNGLLLDDRRLEAIAPHLSLLAISLDGAPASHDRMRGRPGAFEAMRRRLAAVRATGVPFGFIFTLSLSNLGELAWAAEFAAGEGAALLQVHPLEAAGRAVETRLAPPDEVELSFAFLEVARLQKQYDGLAIQYDVLDRNAVRCDPAKAFVVATPDAAALAAGPLARFLPSLVVQADGWAVPLQYGFSTGLAVGRLGGGDFRRQARDWLVRGYPDFLALAREVWDEMAESPPHLPFANWYARMSEASCRREPPTAATMAAQRVRPAGAAAAQ